MNTKQSIIESYLNLGMDKGFENVSLQNLADANSIKKASIFSHFKDYDDLKNKALDYCTSVLGEKNFEINPKAPDVESLFLNLINSFIDAFTEFPVNALLSLINQKKEFDHSFKVLSERIDLMITSRFQVALDFCIQRSWTNLNNTDELAVLFSSYLRGKLEKSNLSDDELAEMHELFIRVLKN